MLIGIYIVGLNDILDWIGTDEFRIFVVEWGLEIISLVAEVVIAALTGQAWALALLTSFIIGKVISRIIDIIAEMLEEEKE